MTAPREPWLRPRERHALSWVAVGTMLFLAAVVVILIVGNS